MSEARLIYLPLGGAGEIGMNCYVYGYGPAEDERLIVVDLGVAFPDMDSSPGVDLIFADVSWLEARKDRIEAIFITHAHEDHVGAVGHLYERLGGVPIYARAFTAEIARRKMQEHGYSDTTVKTVGKWPDTVTAGPFTVGFVPVSHSIPESSGLVIDSKGGRVLHTGDFKIDVNPGVGEPFDHDLWRSLGKDGVTALVCDSTNVFSKAEGRSESTVGPEIEKFLQTASGMVAATTFASNISRVRTIAQAAERAGRSVCLLGRSMRRMVEVATEVGILDDFPGTISPDDVPGMPRENVLLLVTGSQGERRAASAQLANGKYMGIKMKEGDTFLFSSKTIPGNERGVIHIMNQFSELGVDVVDDSDGLYHVSGHANRPDLDVMRDLVKPQTLIPMHGEHRHLREHVKISEAAGVQGVLAVNGMMIDLSGNQPTVAEYIETGRTYLDGSVKIGQLDGIVRDRLRMARNGHVIVTLIIDEDGDPLGDPWCELMGLPETGRNNVPLVDVLEEDLSQFLNRANDKTIADDSKLEKELRTIARKSAQAEIGKKPEVTVVISRLA
ncbi:ribonuclease J [Thalassorhabdomicrobium marinisediminis]|uniref:MBL fold hydrolase n=1 Tax=Thalassorhabdomicrobium marinisediminis TaxID=2170577 RepID=A0A2T7G0N7_9RHOB|nr:ribonuclease J [Thalassorhabdomicrobium marinisediminis]PVA07979.1 MBL fold hydrolase [Thalassorhabdomicrobium marinisediminis]